VKIDFFWGGVKKGLKTVFYLPPRSFPPSNVVARVVVVLREDGTEAVVHCWLNSSRVQVVLVSFETWTEFKHTVTRWHAPRIHPCWLSEYDWKITPRLMQLCKHRYVPELTQLDNLSRHERSLISTPSRVWIGQLNLITSEPTWRRLQRHLFILYTMNYWTTDAQQWAVRLQMIYVDRRVDGTGDEPPACCDPELLLDVQSGVYSHIYPHCCVAPGLVLAVLAVAMNSYAQWYPSRLGLPSPGTACRVQCNAGSPAHPPPPAHSGHHPRGRVGRRAAFFDSSVIS